MAALGDLQRLLDALELDRTVQRRGREAARPSPLLPLVRKAGVDDQPGAPQAHRRALVRAQIPRRTDRQRLLLQKEGGLDALPHPLAVTDRQLDLVALQIEHPRGRHELQLDVGVIALKGAELRDQPGRRERGRQSQAHHVAAGRTQQALGRRLDLAERRIDLLEVTPAGRCQPHAGAGPVEQRSVQKILEPSDLMADG
jgi:hypothetical protein